MTKSGKDGDGEDARLWKAVTRDVHPLPGRRKTASAEPKAAKAPAVKKAKAPITRPPKLPPSLPTAPPPQLDGRTAEKLRKGKIAIDARLDLHGHTQATAHRVLEQFVLTGHARGYRCLLVITGKGKMGEGVLREKLPLWLSLPPLGPLIVKHTHAAPKDGGSGAFYLYLKRTRSQDN